MDIDGGATGPLYGSLFLGMSEAVQAKPLWMARLSQGCSKAGWFIEKQTKARVGDKTMMDALIPAVQALRANASDGADIWAMLDAAAKAAMQGAETTRLIPARFGRAKYPRRANPGTSGPGVSFDGARFPGLA